MNFTGIKDTHGGNVRLSALSTKRDCCIAEIVKAISAPLNACVKGFPAPDSLHPFERALLDLTVGLDAYQRRLGRVAAMRQACVGVWLPLEMHAHLVHTTVAVPVISVR
jgi:GTP1/Obg family GTP-binding protein